MKKTSTSLNTEQPSFTTLLLQENARLRLEMQQMEAIIQQQKVDLAENERRWRLSIDDERNKAGGITKSQERVRRTNAYRLSNLISSLQEGILLEDENRAIVLVNQHYCELFAIATSPTQMKGMDCTEMAEQTKVFFKHPEQYVVRVKQLLQCQRLVTGEELELVDGRILERDYVPIFTNGVYAGHLWKYIDITKRKLAENASVRLKEKYQRIIENMNLGLIEVDLEERIVYTNHSFCIMSGYEPDELIGKIASDVILSGQNLDILQEKNKSRLRGAMDTYEIAIKNKRGESVWWLVSGGPIYAETGEVIGSTGIHLDITKQKQLESELRVAKQEAERSSRSKELFLANMSHEIRTPMNAILNLGQQLTKTDLTDNQHFFLNMINTAAGNLLVIINDILDFSKIEAGQLSLEHIGFSMSDLLQRAIHMMAEGARKKGLRLEMSVDSGLAPVLMGDPFRLNQILLNLIGNAIKFTEVGGVQVRCQSQTVFDSQVISLQIKDTGIGMNTVFQKNLFAKFTQEDGSIGRRYGGTGLGMSITKQLVDLMGGVIEVDSLKGIGTTINVQLTFPVGTASKLLVVEPSEQDVAVLASKRILLVEDNEMNRLVVRTLLTPYGVTIFEEPNGLKALETLRTKAVDLVLMDVQMPVMDGLEATRVIREEISNTLPVIAMTASAIRSEKEACYEAGMNDFLAKPFDEKEMVDKLIKWTSPASSSASDRPRLLYDLSKLKTIGRSNKEFITQMISLFCADAPSVARQLKDAQQQGDYEKVQYLAHRIKPSIDNMGLHEQTTVIRQIERLVIVDPTSPELVASIDAFGESIAEVVDQLQSTYLNLPDQGGEPT